MSKTILITGGAGFIGSHLADELLRHGYRVKALDCLIPQVHGNGQQRPDYLDPEVELLRGDVRNPQAVKEALKGTDAVFHFAARVGVGQSMYEIREYTDVNNTGTAVLMEALSQNPVERLVTASSMSIYGEGTCRSPDGRQHQQVLRTAAQLKKGQWEPRAKNGDVLQPVPTSEQKTPALASVYALSKYDQERMTLVCGQAYQVPVTALRFFNVYGTRQALSNPYTGVLAIFASRYLNGKSPLVFEDGRQRRDFVHVRDVVRACRLALETPEAAGEVFNIGSGKDYTIAQLAREMGQVMGRGDITPEITGKYRVGDIRHCFADMGKAAQVLNFTPQVPFGEGMAELAGWVDRQIATDHVDQATRELSNRGLTV